jgi:hypothetical protein
MQDNSANKAPAPAEYLVPPVRFALVHLMKPFDVATVAQTIMATGHVLTDTVGQKVKFDDPKVNSKLRSWNIEDPQRLLDGKSRHYDNLTALRDANQHTRLIGTVVSGGENPFRYEWQKDDIIVIGGANGLSGADIRVMDDVVTIPTNPNVPFLTVSTVVNVLTYHILRERGWDIAQDSNPNISIE